MVEYIKEDDKNKGYRFEEHTRLHFSGLRMDPKTSNLIRRYYGFQIQRAMLALISISNNAWRNQNESE